MDKEAVTVDDLYRKTTSAPNVNIIEGADPSDITSNLGGASTQITRRQFKKLLGGIYTDDRPKSMVGAIEVQPDTVNKFFPGVTGRTLSSPEARRGLTALTAAHELAERRVAPKDIKRVHNHLSPDVLMKERNAIARLEGPGADEAREAIAKFRESSGEADHMKRLLTRAYGPRAAQFLEGDQKVSKAMRKGLLRKMRENPSIIQETFAPSGSMDGDRFAMKLLDHHERVGKFLKTS
jgi:hypothetical protein